MLSLHKLMVFEAAAREGSLSAAAESLFMSQSSVSQHIRELERGLGVELFKRGRGGVTLTPKGEQLLVMAEKLLRDAIEIERKIMDVAHVSTGRLRLGATPGVSAYLIPGWLRTFRETYSHVEVALHTGTTDNVVQGVSHRAFDLGITEGDPSAAVDHITYEKLTGYEQYIVVGQHHPWWGREQVTLEELEQHSIITRQPGSQSRIWLENLLEQHGVRVEVAAAFDGLETIKQFVVQSDQCFTVLPRYTTRGEEATGQLHAIRVTGENLVRWLWLVHSRDMPLTPFAETFVQTLRNTLPA